MGLYNSSKSAFKREHSDNMRRDEGKTAQCSGIREVVGREECVRPPKPTLNLWQVRCRDLVLLLSCYKDTQYSSHSDVRVVLFEVAQIGEFQKT